jgi:hypothetical protein
MIDRKRILVGVVVCGLVGGISEARSGVAAKNYADQWAMGQNLKYKPYGNDCTNFVSQCIGPDGGGFPMIFDNSSPWYNYYSNGWKVTNSWVNVDVFLVHIQFKGWGTWKGYQPPAKYNNALYGDVLAYDWDGNGSWDHLTIEVAYDGCDPKNPNYCGDLVDEHSSNRYHAKWTLEPYNAYWRTTRIGLYRLNY